MLESDQERVLVTVTGPDTPGITAALTGVLASKGARLRDIEQVVVQGQLTLCLLVGLDSAPGSGEPVLKDLLFTAKRMGLDLDFAVVSPDQNGHAGQSRYAVTAIGDGLDAGGVHVIADVLARHGANIEQIRQLSGERLGSLEIIVGLPPEPGLASTLRRDLIRVTADLDIDVAVQRERLTRRAKRLVIMDMDSTLIRIEVIDELAAMHGVGEQVSEITRRAMGGELDFEQSLRERVGLLRGLSVEKVHALAADLPITEGAREMLRVLRKLGFKTGVISGGFTFAAYALKDKLGLDYAYANELVEADGVLTGEVKQPVVSPQRKADLLDAIAQREGIALEQTIAIGDGANDLAMLERAGLGIAFHAKPRLREQADTALRAGGLDRILYLLGLHAHDIAELLAD